MDDEQDTSVRGSGESGNENDSTDFFGDASGEEDYAVEEFSAHHRVIHFLHARIHNHKNRQNKKTSSLLKPGCRCLMKELQPLIYTIN